jgi:filamentous hemagglutinin family protein
VSDKTKWFIFYQVLNLLPNNSTIMKTFVLFFTTLLSLLARVDITNAQTNVQVYSPSNRPPVADGTLGTQVSIDNKNFNITGGIRRGTNTFHSFTDFSVPIESSVTFANSTGNQSIITRVTGSLFSDINGKVDTQGANFFLINPNGVLFGPGTQLNVGQVFAASTANGIDLVADGGKIITFGTSAGVDAPLIAINPNVFFVSRFNLGGGSGEIKNFGSLQTGNSNQYIGLIGGNVSLIGDNTSIDAGQIVAPGGRVELGGLSAPGSVGFAGNEAVPKLSFPTDVARSNVLLTSLSATVNVTGVGGGNIAITAQNIDLLEGASLIGGISEGLGSPETIAGDIKLKATDMIRIGSLSAINNDLNKKSIGGAGNIIIDAGNISLENAASLSSLNSGEGSAGNIMITAKNSIFLTNAEISSRTLSGGIGSSGNIIIDTGSLSASGNSRLVASTAGEGNAGNVTLKAKDSLSFVNSSIFSTVEPGGIGDGGNIDVRSSSLSLQNGSQLQTITRNASETQPAGEGNAGMVTLNVTGAINLAGVSPQKSLSSVIGSSVEKGTRGDAGSITVNAGSLSLADGAFISAATAGAGNANTVKVNATDSITIIGKNGSNPSNLSVTSSLTGTAGDIIVSSPKITLDNGGAINAFSASGSGGNITIGGSESKPGSVAAANNLLLLRRDAKISTDSSGSTQQGSNGGNININSNFIIAVPNENSDITANAVRGQGGNVTINSQGLFGIQNRPQPTSSSDITASSEFGQTGNISINTPGIDPGKDTGELPTVLTDASKQIAQACSATGQVDNKLVITGQGGHPPNSIEQLNSDAVWRDPRTTKKTSIAQSNFPATTLASTGWIFDGKGNVTFTANNSPGKIIRLKVACPAVPKLVPDR